MPIGYVLVSDSRGNIKHDNTTLAVDVIAISKTPKFFLARGVPYVELDLAVVLFRP